MMQITGHNDNTINAAGFRPLPGSFAASDAAPEHEEAFRHIAEAIERVNQAIARAVNAGHCVEIVRTSRCHDGRGHWGDQMSPSTPGVGCWEEFRGMVN